MLKEIPRWRRAEEGEASPEDSDQEREQGEEGLRQDRDAPAARLVRESRASEGRWSTSKCRLCQWHFLSTIGTCASPNSRPGGHEAQDVAAAGGREEG
mmetsp:Transcript_15379/g.40983  ORF Transcript_15379/g.40983 Transcript_15379/m.40983 type:complete len:98 (-) Transcript_15379:142-435(-)